MDHDEAIQHLRNRAAHCRRLAETASDPEVGEALRAIADDIDAAIPILEQSKQSNEEPSRNP